MARRKKIQVNPINPINSVANDLSNIGLIIRFKIEFSKDYIESTEMWTNGLSGEKLLLRQREIRVLVNYFNHDMSTNGTTKSGFIFTIRSYFRSSLSHDFALSSQAAIENFRDGLIKELNAEIIGKPTFKKKRSQLKSVLSAIYNIDNLKFDKWFPSIGRRTGKLYGARIGDDDTAGAYTSKDFVLQLSLFIKAARFYAEKYKNNNSFEALLHEPFTFKNKYTNTTFVLKHNSNQLINEDNYILNIASYFYFLALTAVTGINSSPLMRLKRSELNYDSLNNGLIKIIITDKRKHLKDKGKEYISKKCYGLIIDEIISFSYLVDSDDSAFLLSQKDESGNFTSIQTAFVSSFTGNQFRKKKKGYFKGCDGKKLIPSAKRLRHTYGLFFENIMDRSFVLSNKPKTAAKYYSNGNSSDNNKSLQKGMLMYEESLTTNADLYSIVSQERKIKKTNVIKITDVDSVLNSDHATRTPSGGLCSNAVTSEEAIRYMRKYQKAGLTEDIKTLHCNNFLACITCRNHIFVDSIDSIYELLSLKKNLEESHYSSESGGLFGSRELIDKAIANIEWLINNVFNKHFIDKALQRIEFEGYSFLWSVE